MSVYRTIGRLAVVSALNNYLQAPWPTLAGPNIFDSKIEPVEDMQSDRVFPCCVVYTDYDKDGWNKGSKVHAQRLMTFTLELLIVQAAQVSAGNGPDGQPLPPTYALDCPYTDSEIETSLDMFEVQIFRALTSGTVASDAFNYLCPSYINVVSRRGASVEGGVRLAARQITMEMNTVRDNSAGAIPPEIAAFLNKLEEHDDYESRVADLRAMLTAPASATANERAMRTFGYTRFVSDQLGAPVGAPVLLPPVINYTITGPSP